MTIFTIGYEKKEIGQFINLLKENRIEVLVDIRSIPYSRNSSYAKKILEKTLQNNGLEYLLKKELGSEKNIRIKVKSDGDYEYFFAEYEKSLIEKSDIIRKLVELAKIKTICLLCYEADFNRCHRKSVAKAIAEMDSKFEIVHL